MPGQNWGNATAPNSRGSVGGSRSQPTTTTSPAPAPAPAEGGYDPRIRVGTYNQSSDDGPFGDPDIGTWFSGGATDLIGWLTGEEGPDEARIQRNKAAEDVLNLSDRLNQAGVSPFFADYGRQLDERYGAAALGQIQGGRQTALARNYTGLSEQAARDISQQGARQANMGFRMAPAVAAARQGMMGGGPSVADARLANAQALAGLQQQQALGQSLEQAAMQQASSRGGPLAQLQANRANANLANQANQRVNAGLIAQGNQAAQLRAQEQAQAGQRYMDFLGSQAGMYGDAARTHAMAGDAGLRNLEAVQARMDMYDRHQRNLQRLNDANQAQQAANLLNAFGQRTALAIQGVNNEMNNRGAILGGIGAGAASLLNGSDEETGGGSKGK